MAASGHTIAVSRRISTHITKANGPTLMRKFHGLALRPKTSAATSFNTLPCSGLARSLTPISTRVGSRRDFSAASTLETTLDTTQYLFTELHNFTGTPWYISIPLIALSLNLVTRLPLTIYTHRIAQRRAKLSPLFQAWHARHRTDVTLDPAFAPQPQQAREAEVVRRFKRTTKRIYSTWGVQRFKDFSGLAVFPVWLIGIETIRRMCRGPRGLLGNLAFGQGDKAASTASSPGAMASEAVASSSIPGDVVSVMDTLPAGSQDLAASGVELSLSTGGCLWFPDLLVADPWHILPFALSAVMVANVLPTTQTGLRRLLGVEQDHTTSVVGFKFRQQFARVLLIMALAIGPATIDMPAALHLYWLSTSAITLIQSALIRKLMPLPKTSIKVEHGNEHIFTRPTRSKSSQP